MREKGLQKLVEQAGGGYGPGLPYGLTFLHIFDR
jgi:hypothetical protein